MNVTSTLIQLALQNPQALFKLNIKLTENGLPFYYEGGTSFNTEYRLYPTPKFVFKWQPPFLHLNEIYLSFRAESNGQLDIVYQVETDQIKITPIAK